MLSRCLERFRIQGKSGRAAPRHRLRELSRSNIRHKMSKSWDLSLDDLRPVLGKLLSAARCQR